RYLDQVDYDQRSKACLITERLAESVFHSEAAVGKTLEIGYFKCSIGGTFREGVPTFGQSEIQDATILVPFPLIQTITGENFLQVIYAQANSTSEVPLMTESLGALI